MIFVIGIAIIIVVTLFQFAGWGRPLEAFLDFGIKWMSRALILVLGAAIVAVAVMQIKPQ